jgi:hypothetical protein
MSGMTVLRGGRHDDATEGKELRAELTRLRCVAGNFDAPGRMAAWIAGQARQ